ncbi:hypothetical protein Ccar_16480 [Clostridium carboxidivorans P7]|nr:hypothetical protein Ccar_16480 [Clostridium carboxidivorans P7]
MYANGNSSDEILTRMKDDVTSDVDKSEGSFVNDVLSPTSKESSNRYSKLDDLLNKAFPQYSKGDYLKMHAASRGVPETSANCAAVNETINGTKGTKIPANTILQTPGGLKYLTTVECIIGDDGKVSSPLKAIDVGSKYNVPANTITQLPISINGVTSVTNESLATGGTDPETDIELLARLLQRVQNPPSSGNKSDYERWAKEVSGVKGVKVIPLWEGPGTVKVICYGENGTPLDSTILSNVKQHIDPGNGTGEGTAPIGATVTIVTVTNKFINITIQGFQGDNSSIPTNLQAYINNLKPGSTIKLINIQAEITNTIGVEDFTGVKLNGSAANVTTTDEEKPILGVITYE